MKTGNTLLFCGAGFSSSAVNLKGTSPIMASEPAKHICRLGNFNESSDLLYDSDRYITENKQSLEKLVNLLKTEYSIKETKVSINNILSFPYRRIYTTNYDDALEMASKKCSILRNSFCLNDKRIVKQNIILHINGRIDEINQENLINGRIKLSKSSYISPNEFEQSEWYYEFKTDLEQANLILFIGYSMYDISIEKILFDGNFKDKTYFIVSENEKEEISWNLKKYGIVLNLGVDKFGELLGSFKSFDMGEMSSSLRGAVQKYEIQAAEDLISDKDIEKFLMQGAMEQPYFEAASLSLTRKSYLIIREKLSIAKKFIDAGKNLFVIGEFGNGKTIFIKELAAILANGGKDVFYLCGSDLTDAIHDIEIIERAHQNGFFLIIDQYVQNKDFLKYVLNSEPCITFILAERTGMHQRWFLEIFNDNITENSYEINIDNLNESELEKIVNIITNLGYWDKNQVLMSREQQINFLKEKCDSHISDILLFIFDSEQVRRKLEDLMFKILTDDEIRKTVMSICILSIGGIPRFEESLISDIAGNEIIYQSRFFNNPCFKQIFLNKYGKIRLNYALAVTIMRNHNLFSSEFKRKFLLDIAQRFYEKKEIDFEHESIFKNVVKFSFLKRIFNDERYSLVAYYDNLKSYVTWLQFEPHFWLQYGMAELNFNNLSKVEQYFDNAYSYAKKKVDYDTRDIDTQYAGLLLRKATSEESDGKKIISSFKEAVDLLKNIENTDYKFRQVLLIKNLWTRKRNFLNRELQKEFVTYCKSLKENISQNEKINFKGRLFEECISFLSNLD